MTEILAMWALFVNIKFLTKSKAFLTEEIIVIHIVGHQCK